MSREDRLRPHRREHDRSVERRAFRPASFTHRLALFLRAVRDETPTEIHGAEPDWYPPGEIVTSSGTVRDPGGGSRLGTPKLRPAFAGYVQGNDGRTERASSDGTAETGESYATPMRWTIRYLERSRHPLLAGVLRYIARRGTYRGLAVRCGTCRSDVELPGEYAEAVAREALRLAWHHYEEAPTTR